MNLLVLVLPLVVEWTLPNGLKVAFLQRTAAPIVSVQLWVHAGTQDGPAHRLADAMFEGSERVRPGDHARFVHRLGGRAGATTSPEATSFGQVVPKVYLDFVVALEADRLRGLVTLEPALKKFYDAWFQPNNALLVVVGDVAEAEVRAAAEKHFGRLPRGPDPPRSTQPAPLAALPRQAGVSIARWKLPDARSPDRPSLAVLASILADGASSRLHQRLVRKDKLAAAAGASLFESALVVYAEHAPEKAERVAAALLDEVERLGVTKVDARALEKAKKQLATRAAFALGDVDLVAQEIGASALFRGSGAAWTSDAEAIQKVTADDLLRVAKTYLVKEGRIP